MRRITSANIACGGHAGTIETMERCIRLGLRHGVNLGAHPGVEGKKGRGDAVLEKETFVHLLVTQVSLLTHLVERAGAKLSHIKLHGTLYHWSENPAHARVYVKTVKKHFPGTRIFALPDGYVYREGFRQGVAVWREIFADRAYRANGALVPRGAKGAVLSNVGQVTRRVEQYAATRTIEAVDRSVLGLDAETICIHGDSENAVAMAKVVFGRLRNLTVF